MMHQNAHRLERPAFGMLLLAMFLAATFFLLAPGTALADESGSLEAGSAVTPSTQTGKTYSIVYKLNGGKQAEGQVLSIASGEKLKTSTLKKPTKPYYRFAGWYADKDLKKKAKTLKGSSSKSKRTVYAKWVRTSYPIVFKTNGGKLASGTKKTVKADKSLKTSKLKKPRRNGYKFAGWYSDRSLKHKAKKVKGTQAASQRTLYAKWKTKKYSLTYKLNGGSFKKKAPKSYKTSKGLASLPQPVRKGYSFIGWYEDAALTKIVTSLPKGTYGKKTLYAKWQKRTLVAHKGYHVDVAANSLPAYEAAYEKGFTRVEGDVRFSWDGVPILVHDEDLTMLQSYTVEIPVPQDPENDQDEGGSGGSPTDDDPTGQGGSGDTGDGNHTEEGGNPQDPADPSTDPENPDPVDPSNPGDGDDETTESETTSIEIVRLEIPCTVGTLNYDVLQSATFKNRKASGVDGKNFTTFVEYIEICKARNLTPNIDLKEGTESQIEMLVEIVDNYGMTYDVVWSSFQKKLLCYVAELHPDARLQVLDDSVPNITSKLSTAKLLAKKGGEVSLGISINMPASQRAAYIKKCKAAGIPLGIWGLSDETKIKGFNSFYSCFSIDALVADRVPSLI